MTDDVLAEIEKDIVEKEAELAQLREKLSLKNLLYGPTPIKEDGTLKKYSEMTEEERTKVKEWVCADQTKEHISNAGQLGYLYGCLRELYFFRAFVKA